MATCNNCKANVGCGCNLLDYKGTKLCSGCYSVAKTNEIINNGIPAAKPEKEQKGVNNKSDNRTN